MKQYYEPTMKIVNLQLDDVVRTSIVSETGTTDGFFDDGYEVLGREGGKKNEKQEN